MHTFDAYPFLKFYVLAIDVLIIADTIKIFDDGHDFVGAAGVEGPGRGVFGATGGFDIDFGAAKQANELLGFLDKPFANTVAATGFVDGDPIKVVARVRAGDLAVTGVTEEIAFAVVGEDKAITAAPAARKVFLDQFDSDVYFVRPEIAG